MYTSAIGEVQYVVWEHNTVLIVSVFTIWVYTTLWIETLCVQVYIRFLIVDYTSDVCALFLMVFFQYKCTLSTIYVPLLQTFISVGIMNVLVLVFNGISFLSKRMMNFSYYPSNMECFPLSKQ